MRLFTRLVALGLILGLLVLMLTPRVQVPGPEAYGDKIAHFLGFLAMAPALQIALAWRDRLGAVLLAVLIGAAVEVIQGWIGRDRSVADLIADAAGAGAAFFIAPRLDALLAWLRREDATAPP